MRVLILIPGIILISTFAVRAQTPDKLQGAAQQTLQSEMTQEGKDCVDARTMAEENTCIAGVSEKSQRNLDSFFQSLLQLLGSDSINAQKLKDAQDAWETYRKKTCDAVGELYSGGTIQPSAVANCRIELLRGRMKDLDALYHTVLHN